MTLGQVVMFFMGFFADGGVVTNLLRLQNAELRQKYILHQFYIPKFAFSVRDEHKFTPVSVLLYLLDSISKQHIFLSNKLVPFKCIVLCECLKCRPQLTSHALRIKVSV